MPGRFCSALLADLGVDVLVIAAPTDRLVAEIGLLGRNKRSMTLDLKAAAGRQIFLRLAGQADVVLEGDRPGMAAGLGVDFDALRALNPRLIYCAVSGYGQDGPYRQKVGHDINYLGYAGVLGFVGEADGPPVLPGVQIAEIGGGGLMAAVGILAALIARERTGRGQFVDVSMLDGAVAFNAYHHLLWKLAGVLPERGRTWLTGYYPCYAVYETRDRRYVTVGAFEPPFWATLCRHFGREDLIAEQWAEGEKREETFRYFRERFRQKTMAEWVQELADKEICFGPVNTVQEALADAQLRHRDMVVGLDTSSGRWTTFGTPIKLSDTPGSIRTPAPRFGEHTDAVLRDLGLAVEEIARLRTDGVI